MAIISQYLVNREPSLLFYLVNRHLYSLKELRASLNLTKLKLGRVLKYGTYAILVTLRRKIMASSTTQMITQTTRQAVVSIQILIQIQTQHARSRAVVRVLIQIQIQHARDLHNI